MIFLIISFKIFSLSTNNGKMPSSLSWWHFAKCFVRIKEKVFDFHFFFSAANNKIKYSINCAITTKCSVRKKMSINIWKILCNRYFLLLLRKIERNLFVYRLIILAVKVIDICFVASCWPNKILLERVFHHLSP